MGNSLESSKNYRDLLREEMERRLAQNSNYSLRAFARDLGLSSARLSEILNGKSGLSRIVASRITKRLKFTDEQAELFCDLVESQHARSQAQRQIAAARLAKHLAPRYQQLSMDTYRAASHWYCYAILALTLVEGFRNDPSWIARALGIQASEAKEAIDALLRLGLLKEDQGRWIASDDFTASPDGVSVEAIRKHHKHLLEKAKESIEAQPVEERDFSSMILAFDSRRLAEARALIRAFRRQFDHLMSDSRTKDRVYCLGIQFFNLTSSLERP